MPNHNSKRMALQVLQREPDFLEIRSPLSDAAPNTTGTVCPLLAEKGLTGLLTIPSGSPDRATTTVPEKPFIAVTENVTGALAAPCMSDNEVEDNVMVKSA
jgi:hypothetical protein